MYAALKLLGDTGSARRFATRQEVGDAVTPVVTTTTSKISRYSCELIDAYEARYGTRDLGAVLGDQDGSHFFVVRFPSGGAHASTLATGARRSPVT